MYHFVYKTINRINGKFYIGKHSTKNIKDGYLGSGKLLLKAIDKYGRYNFEIIVLHWCDSSKKALLLEKKIVNEKFILRGDTYNLKVGGEGGGSLFISNETRARQSASRMGKIVSKETRVKISASNMGKTNSPEHIAKCVKFLTGRKLTDEHKRNCSLGHIGIIFTEDHCANISKAKTGTGHHFYGNSLSEDHKKKISESNIGKNIGPQEQVTCPHCGSSGGICVMKRWHFDNCKCIVIY